VAGFASELGSPRYRLQAQVQPITRSLLRIDLSIIPDFRWDEKIHGTAETFVIMVEDVDGEIILFSDSFVLRQRYAEDEHNVTITVPMFEPVPPNYYISVIADRWLHAETRLPISFKHLILPEKFPQPTALLELQALPLSALHNKEFEAIYSSSIRTFNEIQTQVFQALYTSDENVFIGAPTGSRKTICAEFALLRLWSKAEQPRALHRAFPRDGRAACVGVEKEIWTTPGRQRNCGTHRRDECGSSFARKGRRYCLHSFSGSHLVRSF
jgi:pre-mRNA-splicing helicase BRR2